MQYAVSDGGPAARGTAAVPPSWERFSAPDAVEAPGPPPRAKSAAQQPKPAPARDLGDRFTDRAALGHGPTDETRGSRTR
ncbi:hypothetical protein GCM10010266_27250 [Streptomyces griseomycini]|nr:hypothetical protein GCM10010266_27250 [Streptomyces griseomycini]GGR20122.1 hypothetical protein GCM10015536_27360 [Streptomyces griseomycini]